MNFFVQRQSNNEEYIEWIAENKISSSLIEAKKYAEELNIGDVTEPLRIVNEDGKVCGWVSRNGWLPSGALAPSKLLKE